jgi:SAM-dependent methyltransferase
MSDNIRFNSEKYLRDFRDAGRYPQIHQPMADAVFELAKGSSVLDICCSTGLLGQRLLGMGFKAIGVERDAQAVEAGRRHGVTLPITMMTVDPATADELYRLIREAGVTILVARRCFSEIFGARKEWGPEFCRGLIAAGVDELFLQGRVYSERSTHPIPHTDAEIAVCGGVFLERHRRGPVAYLTKNEEVAS